MQIDNSTEIPGFIPFIRIRVETGQIVIFSTAGHIPFTAEDLSNAVVNIKLFNGFGGVRIRQEEIKGVKVLIMTLLADGEYYERCQTDLATVFVPMFEALRIVGENKLNSGIFPFPTAASKPIPAPVAVPSPSALLISPKLPRPAVIQSSPCPSCAPGIPNGYSMEEEDTETAVQRAAIVGSRKALHRLVDRCTNWEIMKGIKLILENDTTT